MSKTGKKLIASVKRTRAALQAGKTLKTHAPAKQRELPRRPRYTLAELLVDFDPDAYRTAVEVWDRAPPVGREVF
jgi:hypothetical protein